MISILRIYPQRIGLAALAAALLAMLTLAPTTAAADGGWPHQHHFPQFPLSPVACTDLATGLAGNPVVKPTPTSVIVPAAPAIPPFVPATPAYCQVNLLYGESDNQNINIRVGLPLNSVDGGTGGVEGAWNGRTQGIGGGGCAGSLNVGGPVAAGYVGSGNDTGHSGGNCEPGVNADGTYNLQFINDFIRNGIKQQVLFMKSIAKRYYGMRPAYNYWNGCSTGGRQGYLLAQELPGELDGILANAPAIYWTRFQTAQMWGQIVMKDLNGAVIPSAKLNYATSKATAACDGNDGVVDGIIDDPRTCTYSAANDPSAICIANGGTSADPNCLTPAQAQAVDKIWDGPRNANGKKIWFHSEPGSGLTVWNGTNPFALAVTQFHWNEHDTAFDWHTVTMFGAPPGVKSYADVAQDGSRNIADVTDTFGDLDKFRKSGGKLLTFVGAYDNFIMPRGVIHYYRQMAARYDRGFADDIGIQKIDFGHVQKFYRLFRAPGVGHCGGGVGPQPQNLFNTLVNWVENGVAPDSILASGGSAAPPTGRTRPLCPYPQTATYNGSGSTDDAANFHCGGDLEEPEVVCADVLTKYKHEVNGPLDFRGTGVNRHICSGGAHHPPQHHWWGHPWWGDHDD